MRHEIDLNIAIANAQKEQDLIVAKVYDLSTPFECLLSNFVITGIMS